MVAIVTRLRVSCSLLVDVGVVFIAWIFFHHQPACVVRSGVLYSGVNGVSYSTWLARGAWSEEPLLLCSL